MHFRSYQFILSVNDADNAIALNTMTQEPKVKNLSEKAWTVASCESVEICGAEWDFLQIGKPVKKM